jgi:hypothetical protein
MNYGLGLWGEEQMVWSESAARKSQIDPFLGWDKLLAQLEEVAEAVERADLEHLALPKPIKPRKDITGVHQTAPGRLLALRPVSRDAKRGIMWECRCDCGGSISIYTHSFTRKEIVGCLECTSQARRARLEHANSVYKERQEAEATDLGAEWGDPAFPRRWRALLQSLNCDERLLFETICDGRTTLSEDLWDDGDDYVGEEAWSLEAGAPVKSLDRYGAEVEATRYAPVPITLADLGADEYQVQMEALDIVLRCRDVGAELTTFSAERIERARQRIELEGINDETIH